MPSNFGKYLAWLAIFYLGFLSGLQSIPGELYESAEIDGASSWQNFFLSLFLY